MTKKKPWSHYDIDGEAGGFFGGLVTELERKPKVAKRDFEPRKGPSLMDRIIKWLNLG